MKRTIKLTESKLRDMIQEAVNGAMTQRRPMRKTQPKRLTENRLRAMIQESVKRALIEEGFFNDTKVGRGIRNGLVGGAMALGSLTGSNCSGNGNNTTDYQGNNQTAYTQNVGNECEQLRRQVDKKAKESMLGDKHFVDVYNACGGAHCYSIDLTSNPNKNKMVYEQILDDMNNGIQFYRIHLSDYKNIVRYCPVDVVQNVLGYGTTANY